MTASRHLPSVATSPSWLILLFGVLEGLLLEVVQGSGRGTRRTGGGWGTDGDEVRFWGCKGNFFLDKMNEREGEGVTGSFNHLDFGSLGYELLK